VTPTHRRRGGSKAKKIRRSTDAGIFIYCMKEQKEALERAASKKTDGIPGARLPTYVFVLQAALKAAAEMGIEPFPRA
jgi:uncharacterized protein (DUF1778 family)